MDYVITSHQSCQIEYIYRIINPMSKFYNPYRLHVPMQLVPLCYLVHERSVLTVEDADIAVHASCRQPLCQLHHNMLSTTR